MELTWLGHGTFRLDAGGKRIYIDPFLNGNPKCPESELTPERVDVIVGGTIVLAAVIANESYAAWRSMRTGREETDAPRAPPGP